MARKSALEEKYIGSEPVITASSTELDMIKAFNFYQYHYNYEDAKSFVISFLKSRKVPKNTIRKAQSIDAIKLINIGWHCRIMSSGGTLPEERRLNAISKLQKLIDAVEPEEKDKTEEKVVISIQERVANKASELIGDLEEEVDRFLNDHKYDFDVAGWMNARNVKPAIAKYIVNYYQPISEELFTALGSKDEDIKYAYRNWRRPDLKKYLEFINAIISASQTTAVTAKGQRKARKKKVKPASVLVSKLKFKDKDDELKIESARPVDIIGAQQLWVFNTKTRVLSRYDAMGPSGLTVKGTTIVGYDEKTSISKKLRKPAITISKLMEGGKIVLRRLLEDIKTTEKQASGRTNKDTILLRVVR